MPVHSENHLIKAVANWKGHAGKFYLTCSCGRLGALVSTDKLESTLANHFGAEPSTNLLRALALTATPPEPAQKKRRQKPRKRRPRQPGAGVAKPRRYSAKPEHLRAYTTGPLTEEQLQILWQGIWTPLTRGTGLKPKQLSSSRAKVPELVGRRQLGLVFSDHIDHTNRKNLAAELGCHASTFDTVADSLPAYLYLLPELLEVAAEITRLTNIELPEATLTPKPGLTIKSSGYAVPIPDPVWNDVLAAKSALVLCGGNLNQGRTRWIWFGLAHSIVLGYDGAQTLMLERILGPKLGIHYMHLYRVIRGLPQALDNDPDLLALARKTISHLDATGITLSPAWLPASSAA